jgi:hypothetical protein
MVSRWLEHDLFALAALLIGIGLVEWIAFGI